MEINIRDYAEAVAKLVGENAEVKEVAKANGVVKFGILVKQGTISPTIYLEEMYENNYSVQQAAAIVLDIAEKNKVQDGAFDTSKFLDYEGYVKPNLRARLYNKSTEADVYRSAASRGFKGLIIVPYVELPETINGERGSVKVRKEHIDKWGVSEKEVIDAALKNSAEEVQIRDLFGMVHEMSGMELPGLADSEMPLVVTNKSTMYGASAILGLISTFKEKYKNGFFVLPSSIHEVLVMPNNGDSSIEMFNAMVHDVNTTTVLPEEVLADNAFFFA